MLKRILSLESRLWSASLLNAGFLLLQLVTIIRAKSVEGVSVMMFIGFVYMQVTYLQAGLKNRQWGMVWGMGASAIISIVIIALVVMRRYF